MPRPRVFVSFAGADRPQVRRLFARLEAQPLELWNYADEAQEVPGGVQLQDFLRARIDQCDVFVAVVTPQSLCNENTRLEIEYALGQEAEGRLRVIPLVTPEADALRVWPAAYHRLRSYRYRLIAFSSAQELEDSIIDLCRDLHLPHVGLIVTDTRLPFLDRFQQEIEDKVPRQTARDNAVYSHLHRVLEDFSALLEEGRYQEALARMAYFILECEYYFPNSRFYYPYVVRAVCEVLCGHLVNARETLSGLLDHPMLDENVFGALGYIAQQQGLPEEAMAHYAEALRRDPADPAARMGLLTNAFLCDRPVVVDEVLNLLDEAGIDHVDDLEKVRSLKAYALGKAGRWSEAAERFRAILDAGPFDPAVVAHYADLLHAWGEATSDARRYREARDLLLRYYPRFPEECVLCRLASLCCITGDRSKAIRYYTELLDRFPASRLYRYEAAYAFWRLGEREAAHEVAGSLLDTEQLGMPQAPDDYYYAGFANWLLGKRERAQYDFERSGRPRGEYYGELFPPVPVNRP